MWVKLRHELYYCMIRLQFRFGEKRLIHGLPIAARPLADNDEERLVFEKMTSALDAIQRFAPSTYKQLKSDVRSIMVAGDPTFHGRYYPKLRMVELLFFYVTDAQTTPDDIACTLVHEAQHARLRRLGFGYDKAVRGRVERICYRAQRNFARLLPSGDYLVAEAEAWMFADLDFIYSKETRRQEKLQALRDLGIPRWLVGLMDWLSKPRTA